MRQLRELILSEAERSSLEALVRAGSTPQQVAGRARLILALGCGRSLAAVARELGTWPQRVARWRDRWLDGDRSLSVFDRLGDEPRPGAPARISPEQCCQIIALACERPEAIDVPITHWSTSDLAREATARGIVPGISPRTVGRLLKRCRPQAPSGAAVADGQT